MQWQISALLALQVFGALAFNPLFLPLSKLTSKSHASVMHSLERKGKLVSSVRGLMEQSACRHPTRWRAPSLTIMAEAKDVICAPIWEAADAITLEDALKINKAEHAAECADHEHGFFFRDRKAPVTGVSDLGITSIPSITHDNSPAAIFRSTKPLLTEDECMAVIAEAESIAAQRLNGWTTERHANFPTTDLPVEDLPIARGWFGDVVEQRVFPFLAQAFPTLVPYAEELRIFDVFVVKYDAAEGGQRQLQNHRDGSLLSLNIALNDAFEGGGTWIDPIGETIRQPQGGVLTHFSSVLHGGREISAGKRYILVGFLVSQRHVEHVRRLMDRGSTFLHEGMFAASDRAYGLALQAADWDLGEDDTMYVAHNAPFQQAVGNARARVARVIEAYAGRRRLLGRLYADVGCMHISKGEVVVGVIYLHMACAVLEGSRENDWERGIALHAWACSLSGNETRAMQVCEQAKKAKCAAAASSCGVAKSISDTWGCIERGADGDLQGIYQISSALREALEFDVQAGLEISRSQFHVTSDKRDDEMLRGRIGKILCERGAILAMQGRHSGAVSSFQAAVWANPKNGEALAALRIAMDDAVDSRHV